jgi:hypothetical protein
MHCRPTKGTGVIAVREGYDRASLCVQWSGLPMCESQRKQYGTKGLLTVPEGTRRPDIPRCIRVKCHEARLADHSGSESKDHS